MILRDFNGHRLGKLEKLSDGREELRDGNGRLLGRYDPKEDKTRDRNNNIVSRGNFLSTLLT